MTIIKEWAPDTSDFAYTKRRFGKQKCCISGEPLEPPFMFYMLDGCDLFINAKSIASLGPANGTGFILDLVRLVHAAEGIERAEIVKATRESTKVTTLARKKYKF